MISNENTIKTINNIKTTMQMENQSLTATDIALLNDFANNKISMEDAINSIKNTIYVD